MKAQDYPVAHFKLMSVLTFSLAAESVQILEHSYTYEAFGSWWVKCSFSGHQFRVVLDGRDYQLSIQKPDGKDWKDIAAHQARDSDPAEMVSYILEAFKRA